MDFVYEPPVDFGIVSLDRLDDYDSESESEEIWLVEYPLNNFPAITEKTVKVKVENNVMLGGFEDSFGKEVDFGSSASQNFNVAVLLPAEEDGLGRKVCRRVSLVRQRESKELLQTVKAKTQQKLVAAVTNSSGKISNTTQSSRHKTRQSASTRSKSVFSGFTQTPKSSKRKHSGSSSGKSTITGSSDRSEKSKKKKIAE